MKWKRDFRRFGLKVIFRTNIIYYIALWIYPLRSVDSRFWLANNSEELRRYHVWRQQEEG